MGSHKIIVPTRIHFTAATMTASAPMLEHDYRQLALISRKSAASSGLTSLLWSSSNAESEDIKDAAERVLLLLRSASAIDRIDSETLMRPVQLACQSKRPELVGQALGIVQKLAGLTNSEHVEGLIGPDEINTVLGLLQSVETLYEESVQLKILQTCLVVLQSPRLHPRNAETILSVVSMCFRAMTPRGKGQVTTTASATVRQAVAIVFSYVDVAKAMTLTNGATSAINSTESVDEDVAADSGQAFANKEYIKASSRLLEDLIALSSGSPARWLKTPSLPNQNTFSLEVLDFALLSHPALFLSLPAFENSISLRIVQLLQSQLQDHIDAASKGTASSNFEAFKAVLKCVRTSLLLYHNVAGRKCRSLVHTLLKGLQSCSSLIHRVAIAQVMRQLLADPELVIFLFATFDAADIGASRTVSPTMAMAASRKEDIAIAIIDVMTSLAESGDGSSATMDAVSQVYFSKDVSFDVDIESTMPAGLQGTSLIVVSLHAVVACMQSVSAIVSHQLYGVDRNDGSQRIDGTGPSRPPGPSGRTESIEELPSSASLVSRLSSFSSPRAFHHPHLPLGDVDRELCEALVAATWAPLVLSITHILKQCSHERLELELLKSLRIFTEAIGKLRLREPMTACLDSLCQIALSGVGSPGIGVAETATDEETTSTATVTPSNTQKVTSQLLRSRNFQAMKTIFEIAGELANDLGPAWNMVLEAMYSMDNVLMDPAVVGSADARVLADIADVKRTMQSLFDSTKYMSREGAVSLLGGLRDVSLHHLPQAEMVSSPKMSALYRMVDVFLANSFRAHDLWAPFLSHVLELLQDSKPSIREAAIDALGKAITGTLANLHSGGLEIGVSNNDNHIEDENASVQIDRLENMVLVALESLHNDRERDVQVGVLKVLAQVLQRNGEHLTDGWIPVFRLLAASAETSSLETVALGCESLQIVYNDYLDKMDDRNIQKFLSVAENYGKQAMDVNVSLSIISMLWNLGDMLGSRDGGGGRTGGGGALSSAGGSDISTEDLLETIYEALFKISKDARPEVRNSGARSLFAMVAAHGNRLSPGLWTACLWDKLFPLLRYSFHMSVTSSKEEAEAALLGQSKGEQVRLVVHHSRNTEQKQWDETVVVCLAGMARLMNSQFERMTRMDGFDDGWSELMLVVESSLAGGRKEVALAAISFLSGLLSGDSGAGCAGCAPGANLADHNNSNRLSEPMWQRGFRAIDVGVVAATSGGCQVPLAVRTELVGLVGAVYEANQDRFDRDRAATVQLYKWVDSFCRNPWSEDDAANPVQPVGMPPVQKSALALLQRLRPGQDAVVWPDYLQAVVNLIEPGHAIAALSGGSVMESHESEALPPPSLAQYRFALNASFVERVMDHLVSLFDVAPMSARAAASPEIINALGRCMEVRCTVPQKVFAARIELTTFADFYAIRNGDCGFEQSAGSRCKGTALPLRHANEDDSASGRDFACPRRSSRPPPRRPSSVPRFLTCCRTRRTASSPRLRRHALAHSRERIPEAGAPRGNGCGRHACRLRQGRQPHLELPIRSALEVFFWPRREQRRGSISENGFRKPARRAGVASGVSGDGHYGAIFNSQRPLDPGYPLPQGHDRGLKEEENGRQAVLGQGSRRGRRSSNGRGCRCDDVRPRTHRRRDEGNRGRRVGAKSAGLFDRRNTDFLRQREPGGRRRSDPGHRGGHVKACKVPDPRVGQALQFQHGVYQEDVCVVQPRDERARGEEPRGQVRVAEVPQALPPCDLHVLGRVTVHASRRPTCGTAKVGGAHMHPRGAGNDDAVA